MGRLRFGSEWRPRLAAAALCRRRQWAQQAAQAPATAAPPPPAVANTVVTIGYAELKPDADPRWDPTYARYEVPVRPWGSSMAVRCWASNDNAPTAKFTHLDYALNRAPAIRLTS